MKHLKFDYGQPLAIVALLLVLSTAFAFFEEPPPSSPDVRQQKAKAVELHPNSVDTPNAANERRKNPLILAEDK